MSYESATDGWRSRDENARGYECAYENAAGWCAYECAYENVDGWCVYECACQNEDGWCVYECVYENVGGWSGDNDPRHGAMLCARSESSCDHVLHPSFGSEECSEWCLYRSFDYDADGAPRDVRFRSAHRAAREDNEPGASRRDARRLSNAVPIALYVSGYANGPQACALPAPGDSA